MAGRVTRRTSAASPFSAKCPLDIAIRETSDAGRPIVAADPDGPHAGAFRGIARTLIERLAAPGQRAAPKIVIG